MLALLLAAALAQTALEIPVDRPREASRTVRRLADAGYSASVVRAPGSLRVRLDLEPADAAAARAVADELSAGLGLGVLVLEAGSPSGAEGTELIAPAGEGLLERLAAAEHVRLTYVREVGGHAVTHDWLRVGDRTSVRIEAAPPLESSRLLLAPDAAVLWTEAGPTPASRAQLESWVVQLGPTGLLAEAVAAGFGGTKPPPEGCRTHNGRTVCVLLSAVPAPPAAGERTLLRGGRTTPDGRWIPIEIERYDGEELEDRVTDLAIAFPEDPGEAWFDADNPRMRVGP